MAGRKDVWNSSNDTERSFSSDMANLSKKLNKVPAQSAIPLKRCSVPADNIAHTYIGTVLTYSTTSTGVLLIEPSKRKIGSIARTTWLKDKEPQPTAAICIPCAPAFRHSMPSDAFPGNIASFSSGIRSAQNRGGYQESNERSNSHLPPQYGHYMNQRIRPYLHRALESKLQ
jgi:hypothetical protein